MNERLKQLYRSQILEMAKNPFNEGEMINPTHTIEAYNPLCGDHFFVYLKLDNGVIEKASFKGYGCAISKASTSLLAKSIEEKTLQQANDLIEMFLELINAESKKDPESITQDERFLAFASAREFPERLSCANLAWEVLNREL